MKFRIERPVTVITPTIGSSKLKDAIESVQTQTYKSIKHLIVVDGVEHLYNVPVYRKISDKYQISVTPNNTGANGFYGHRIYAAYPHLLNDDFIFFLDEDNWFEPDHVASLVDVLESNDNQFAYSLRKIYDENKVYQCDDNCESLGKWPIYFTHDNPQYHVDTSSYAFRREFLVQCCHIWHHGWGGDRRFYNAVRHVQHDTNGIHSLCYRLDGNPNSVSKEFFDKGNTIQNEYYKGNLPWIRT